LKGGPQLETLRQITADIDNVRAAWQRAIKARDCEALDRASECLYLFSELSGALAAGERAFHQAAHALRAEELESMDGCASVEAFLLMGEGTLRAHRGDLQRGQALLEHGLALLNAEDYERSSLKKRAFGLLWLGWVLFLQARNTEAQEALQRSLELYGELGDRWGVAKNLYIMGNSLTGSGRLSEAEPPLRQSLAISHEIGDRRSRLLVDWNLAILDFWFGDYAQTEAFLADAAMLGREFNDQIGLALALKERGKLEVARGEYEQAIQTFHESIAITDEIGSQWESAATLDDLALALCLSGDHAGAESAVRQCLLASQARQHRYFVARCYGDLGLIAFKRREFQQAEKNLLDALGIWQDLGHEPYLAWVRCQLGHLRHATSPERKHEAAEDYGRALQMSVKHGLAPIAMEVFGAVGAQLAEVGDLAAAFTLLALASHHPASTYATREKARQVVADLGIDLSLHVVTANGEPPDWAVTVTELTERMAHWDSGPSER
jgi:tetratricopeptide (TPR) repeat protein